jgi:pSer/pThr/pTyr-binding forkhead associated (FHA) protein
VEQVLQGGALGAVVHSRDGALTLGRESCDLNFPLDPFLSPSHARVELASGRLLLTDLGTRNGTYVRVRERELQDGDYVFIGRKLLRVELNKN